MSDKETFEIVDGGLNARLDNLSNSIESTRKTLDEISNKMITSSEHQSRKASRLQILYLILTLFIAASACLSAYFSYRTVQISSEIKSLQSTQTTINKIQAVKDFVDLLNGFNEGIKASNKGQANPSGVGSSEPANKKVK